jgi:hypothetical protein
MPAAASVSVASTGVSASPSSSSSVFSMLAEVGSHALSAYKKSLTTKVMMIDALMVFSVANTIMQVLSPHENSS